MAAEQLMLEKLSEMRDLVYKDGDGLKTATGKDIVLFLGNTRAGKSTTVNYAIGNALSAKRITPKRKFMIRKEGDSAGPAIGAGPTSETKLPTVWPSKKLDGLVADAPGFDDNRGEPQDVANAFHLRQLIFSAASVRFVIVADINDIASDNVGRFTGLMDKISSMLPNYASLAKGILLVFTKDDCDTSKEDVCSLLRDKVIDRNDMKVLNRELVKLFANNEKHIVIVNMPKAEGLIKEEDNIFNDLISSVKSLKAVKVKMVVPGLADKSRSFLLEARHHLTESKDIDDVLRRSEKVFTEDLDRKCKSIGSIEDGKELQRKLGDMDVQIQSLLNKSGTLEESLKKLGDLVPNVSALKKSGNIYSKLRFISFVDSLLKMNESDVFVEKVKRSWRSMKARVCESLLAVQERISLLMAEENERRTKAEEEEQRQKLLELKRLQEEQERNIILLQQQIARQHTCGRGGDCILQ